MTPRIVALVLFVGLTPIMHAESADLAADAKEILRTKCSECHSGPDAAGELKMLDYSYLTEFGYLEPGSSENSVIHQVITSIGRDVMPPSSRPGLEASEIDTIRKWILKDAEPFPADVGTESDDDPARQRGDQAVLEEILQYVVQAPAEDRPFLRFFSFRHLVDNGVTADRLKTYRDALAKTINHLSQQKTRVKPEPIDALGDGSILVVDIRQLGWDQIALKSSEDPSETLQLFDLVLLEYPYSVIPTNGETYQQIEEEFLATANQVRPIPFLRADWFCSIALQPPLYHELLQLPRTLAELEDDIGVDIAKNFEKSRMQRAGITVSGVSKNNRIVERHLIKRRYYYWKSHDFVNNEGSRNIFADPLEFEADSTESIFQLRNGAHGYFLSDRDGNRINEAPTDLVIDHFASDRVVRNGLGCIRCHHAGLEDFNDVVADSIRDLTVDLGFDQEKALEIYPKQSDFVADLEEDRNKWVKAMKRLGFNPWYIEPISIVTGDFLDGVITTNEAANELGVTPEALVTAIQSSAPASLPLSPLTSGNTIRRDAWEDNLDTLVEALKLGTRIIPVDGESLRRRVPASERSEIALRSSATNAGAVEVVNGTDSPLNIQLFSSSATDGHKSELTEGITTVGAGETYTSKDVGTTAEVILFASSGELPEGHIYRGQRADDRVIHEVDGTPAGSDAAEKMIVLKLVMDRSK